MLGWRAMSMSPATAAAAALAALAGLAGCRDAPAADAACRCAPDNRSRARLPDGSVLDGAALLARLRRHRDGVALHRPARDVKLVDDELRLELASFCQPCSDWIDDRLTVDDMFPLDRLDDATGAVCLGLVLRDGTTAWGRARPRACR
jgi:hypothetical protein